MSPPTPGKIFTLMPLKGSTQMMTLNQMTAGTALHQNLSVKTRPDLRSPAMASNNLVSCLHSVESNKAAASLHSNGRCSDQPSELCQFPPHTAQATTTKAAFLLHPPHPKDSTTRLLPGNCSMTSMQLRLLHLPSTTTTPLWLCLTSGHCRPTVC